MINFSNDGFIYSTPVYKKIFWLILSIFCFLSGIVVAHYGEKNFWMFFILFAFTFYPFASNIKVIIDNNQIKIIKSCIFPYSAVYMSIKETEVWIQERNTQLFGMFHQIRLKDAYQYINIGEYRKLKEAEEVEQHIQNLLRNKLKNISSTVLYQTNEVRQDSITEKPLSMDSSTSEQKINTPDGSYTYDRFAKHTIKFLGVCLAAGVMPIFLAIPLLFHLWTSHWGIILIIWSYLFGFAYLRRITINPDKITLVYIFRKVDINTIDIINTGEYFGNHLLMASRQYEPILFIQLRSGTKYRILSRWLNKKVRKMVLKITNSPMCPVSSIAFYHKE